MNVIPQVSKSTNLRFNAANPPKGVWPKMYVNVWNGSPRFVVELGDRTARKGPENGFGTMDAPFNLLRFLEIVQYLEDALEAEPGHVVKFESLTQNRETKEFVLKGTFVIMKDESGIVCMSVSAKDQPRYKFPLMPDGDRYCHIQDKAGNKLDPKVVNRATVKAFCVMCRNLIPLVCQQTATLPKQQNGGFGGGGGSGNSGGGFRDSPKPSNDDMSDDDIPY